MRGEDAFTPLETPSATTDYAARIADLACMSGQLAVENVAFKKALQRVLSKPAISV
ncbi:MAG: hypothetical protein IPO81_27890 [Kouleothrix sp.]|nr:hypothetical protein [Kouleothrix sp.]